jgi:hypothetical protein
LYFSGIYRNIKQYEQENKRNFSSGKSNLLVRNLCFMNCGLIFLQAIQKFKFTVEGSDLLGSNVVVDSVLIPSCKKFKSKFYLDNFVSAYLIFSY